MANDKIISGSNQSAPPPKAAPYDSSVTLVAAAAFLSPLAAAAWSIHRAGASHGDPDDPLHRHLHFECNWTGAGGEGSSATGIAFTSVISGSAASLCLLLYELFRRDPVVGKYIYDRKRLSQPRRTPPPLMLSRSLWDGNGSEDDACCKLTCCRVRPAVLELAFLKLDDDYLRYARAAADARIKRECRGLYACCRRGRYHENCRNKRCPVGDPGEGKFVDEDGYVFYREYRREYSHVYHSRRSYSPEKRPRSGMAHGLGDQGPDEEVRSFKWGRSASDLFPEDNPRNHSSTAKSPQDEHPNPSWEPSGSDDPLRDPASDPSNSEAEASLIPKGDSRDSASVRTECVDDFLEQGTVSPGSFPVVETSDEEDAAGDTATTPLRYPYRLKYLLMPPGFHTWTSVLDFMGHFFLLQGRSRWCRALETSHSNSLHRRKPSSAFRDRGKGLTEGEEELLRCAGLDTYLLVRLARFGFDVTFYPFLFACVAVLPVYHSSRDPAAPADDGFLSLKGNLSLNVTNIPEGSGKMIWIVLFTIVLYLSILRRLWIEWEAFIKLRHSFLANGDTSIHNNPSYLRKYRNTCIVECVPKSHQSDRNLKDFFERLYPGQIENAEMMIDTSKLEEMVKKRRKLVAKYDDINARYRYDCWMYKERKGSFCRCKASQPSEPKVRDGLYRKKVDALTYYNNKIKEVDTLADEEYNKIVQARLKWHDFSLARSEQGEDGSNRVQTNLRQGASQMSLLPFQDMYTLLIPSYVRKTFFGEESDFCYGTGMVTFKSITAKQSAVQCNLSGHPSWMLVNEAPDPRDLLWSNIGVDLKLLEDRKVIVQFVLLIGILVWGTIVTFIQDFTEWTIESIPSFSANVVQGYLPAFAVSIILQSIPNLFFILARRVIRFKSYTQCDEFVMIWNTGYRLANIFFSFFAMSLVHALQCIRENPEKFLEVFADGILRQAVFLMKLMIVATGQETMLQLLQWRSLIKQAVIRPLTNVNARSRGYLDWLNAAPEFEQSFHFGFFAPVLSYGLMIAMVFAFLAPIMLVVCAVFFWTAARVHMHNALFVYCQRCEGGGKIFYYWNRIVFITLYTSILIFSGILALKKYALWSIAFVFIMTLITYCVDRSVKKTFVIHSLHLPITRAKIHDEEEEALLSESNIKPDEGEKFMYRNPILNQNIWNSRSHQAVVNLA